MSNALAISSVTFGLHHLLEQALKAKEITGMFPNSGEDPSGVPDVSALPLDYFDEKLSAVKPRLNIFHYETAVNPGWSNTGLPSRSPAGQRTTNPPLALDLSYLLTAIARKDFETEMLLGAGVQAFHETPGLSREKLRELAKLKGTGGFPKEKEMTFLNLLADQIETIKIIPRFLKMDDMAKLWSCFQCHYRPSVAYLVSVVLIQSTRPTRSAMPVLQRGPQPDNGLAGAGLVPPFPTLLAARAPRRVRALRAVTGHFDILRLYGHHLSAGKRSVVFRHSVIGAEIVVTDITERAPDLLEADLERDPTLAFADVQLDVNLQNSNWIPGKYTAEVNLEVNGAARRSNAVSIDIMPEFDPTKVNVKLLPPPKPNEPQPHAITLATVQKLRLGQTATLFLDDLEVRGAPEFGADPQSTQKVVFTGVLPLALRGTSPRARLLVDGVESPVIKDEPPQPLVFDPSQRIKIPA